MESVIESQSLKQNQKPSESERVKEHQHRAGLIALVGPANAGKSTLLNALLEQKVSIVSAKPHTTRDRILGIKHLPDAECVFVDSPGFCAENYNGALSRYLRKSLRQASTDVDLCVLVLDARVLAIGNEYFDDSVKLLKRDAGRSPDLIVLNKVDLLSNEKLLQLLAVTFENARAAFETELEIFPLSAKKGFGLVELERSLVSRLPVGVKAFPVESFTDKDETFIIQEVIREKLIGTLKQELPYSTAVRVEKIDEDKTILRIKASILVERDSQKGIVIGKGGTMLKDIGTRARIELEKLLENKIHLELLVKVEEGWTETDKGVRKVGYEV